MDRRGFLKTLGATTAGAIVTPQAIAKIELPEEATKELITALPAGQAKFIQREKIIDFSGCIKSLEWRHVNKWLIVADHSSPPATPPALQRKRLLLTAYLPGNVVELLREPETLKLFNLPKVGIVEVFIHSMVHNHCAENLSAVDIDAEITNDDMLDFSGFAELCPLARNR